MSKIKNIIFDFGGVLVDWNPKHLYSKIFDNETDMDYFLENICTSEWNIQQDAGRPLSEATEMLQKEFPEYKDLIGLYYSRWAEMLGGTIEANVKVLQQLHKRQYPIYGLTNWSAETITIAYNKYDFFALIKGVVVSGKEKLIKPDPRIYQLLLDRYQLKATESLFIDDNSSNITTAQKMGFQTIHVTDHTNLEIAVKKLGLLI